MPADYSLYKFPIYSTFFVNIKSVGDGENSFKYLAAYTQRGFIGNDRIVKYNGVKSGIAMEKQMKIVIEHFPQ